MRTTLAKLADRVAYYEWAYGHLGDQDSDIGPVKVKNTVTEATLNRLGIQPQPLSELNAMVSTAIKVQLAQK